MNTKFTSFVLLLALTTTVCAVSAQNSSGQQVSGSEGRVPTATSTSTPTTEPSPTNTPPPTETHTPRPPTNTPTPAGKKAEVTGKEGVNVRVGPCNQPIMGTAPLGMEFPVTGWYKSPNGYIWWRITLTSKKTGKLYEGWVFGDLVEVTNSSLVPEVAARCPSFTTTPPAPTEQVSIPTTAVSPDVLPACQTRIWQVGGNGTGRFLWPDLVQGLGDREFDGNGPKVTVRVYFGIDVRKGIWGRIQMRAEETKADWSTAVGDTGWFRLHEGAPAGWRISSVNLTQVDPTTGLYYSELTYIDDDHDLDVYHLQDGGPVRTFIVTGDTKGDDIGSGEGDTHVLVGFNEIRVELIQESNCQ